MRHALAFLIALTFAGPATAQSFEEAVRGNLALALKLCLSQNGRAGDVWAQDFYAAGFTGRVDRSTVNSDTTHYFTAPAGTVEIELYYGETPDYCGVSSNHLGVSGAAEILDKVVPVTRPGYVRKEVPGQGVTCVTYEDPSTPIGALIGYNSMLEGDCIDDGTIFFFSTYRV